jgi:hypothetical protein
MRILCIVKILVAVMLSINSFFIGGCTTAPTYELTGTVSCSNCGVSKDGLLRIESTSSLRSMKLVITNLSDEPIYIDERYCSFTDSNEVQPLEAWLTGAMLSKATSVRYESSEFTTRTGRDLFTLLFGSRTTGSSLSEEVTNEIAHNPIIIIPKQSNYTLYCNDWYGYYLNTIHQKNLSIKDKYGIVSIDTTAMKQDVNLLRNRPLGITLVYRKLNETQWSNTTVTLQSPDVSMTTITKKPKSSKK